MPRLQGVREQRHQPRYDILVREDGTSVLQSRTLLFGNNNTGQTAKTNMVTAGVLAGQNSYVILALRTYLSFETGTLYSQTERGLYFTLEAGEKAQIQGPVWYVPAGGGLHGYDSTASTHHVSNGVPSHEAILKLAKPITLPPQQQFQWVFEFFTISGGSGEDARSSLNADTGSKVIMAMIDGLETRDVL